MLTIEEIRQILSTTERNQVEYLRSSDVMKMLNVSASTLQNLRNSGLPYSKVNGTCFYKYSDLIELIEKNSINDNPSTI